MCGGRMYTTGRHPITGAPWLPHHMKPLRPIKKPKVKPPPQPPELTKFAVPMTGVKGRVTVQDLAAEYEVKQRFENREDTPIEAVYEFPLMEGAAVSNFWAEVDGKKILGEIKEKEEAKDDYDDAIASGHGAYLLEEDETRPNVFSASVGNLPPGKEVLVVFTFVIELEFTDEQFLRLAFPGSGSPPFEVPGEPNGRYHKEVDHGLELEVDFFMSSGIKKVSSPTHPIEFEFGDTTQEANVKLARPDKTADINRDFFIDVTLRAPHQANVKVEAPGGPVGGKTLDHAAMLSIFPDLNEEDVDEIYNEMIFLVDRSGSMTRRTGDRTRIQAVKDSLHIFLRSLPEGSLFNIIGFGTKHRALFEDGAREYDESSLEEATKHVDAMRANMGGTNILRPLQEIFAQPPKEGIPRIVFVLTDGEVNNTQECVDSVRDHSDTTRVFTLGIGGEASKKLVVGMAKAGEGKSFIVKPEDNLDARVMSCLNAAAKPALTNLRVDWGDALRGKVRQTPFKMPPLFAGSRLCVYGFLDSDLFAQGGALAPGADPVEVTVHAETGAGPFKATATLSHDESISKQENRIVGPLAAKSMIRDLEENRSDWHFDADGKAKAKPSADKVKDEIIRLSLASNVISKHTAFIAVEERDEATEGEMKLREMKFEDTSMMDAPPKWKQQANTASSVSVNKPSSARGGSGPPPRPDMQRVAPKGMPSRGGMGGMRRSRAAPQAPRGAPPPPGSGPPMAFGAIPGGGGMRGAGGGGGGGGAGAMPLSMASSSSMSAGFQMQQQQQPQLRAASRSKKKSKESVKSGNSKAFFSADRGASANYEMADDLLDFAKSAAPAQEEARSEKLMVAYSSDDASENEDEEEAGESQTDDSMRALIRLQRANGSFDLAAIKIILSAASEADLRDALGSDVATKLGDAAVLLAATAVAVALFEKRWTSSKITWNMVVKKARGFLRKEGKKAGADGVDWDAVGTKLL